MAQDKGSYLAHFLTFGKITDVSDGAVVGNPGERVTSHSENLPRELRLTITPETVMGNVALRREDLHPSNLEAGAIVIREPEHRIPAILARIRFPSETGIGRGGRHYSQMTAAFIPPEDWNTAGPAVLNNGLEVLTARADTLESISSTGDLRPQLAMRMAPHKTPTNQLLSVYWFAIGSLASTGRFCAGTDLLSDQAQFLQLVALFAALSPVPSSRMPSLTFVSGIASSSAVADICFCPAPLGQARHLPTDSERFVSWVEEANSLNEMADFASGMRLQDETGARRELIARRFGLIRDFCLARMNPREAMPAYSSKPETGVAGMGWNENRQPPSRPKSLLRSNPSPSFTLDGGCATQR